MSDHAAPARRRLEPGSGRAARRRRARPELPDRAVVGRRRARRVQPGHDRVLRVRRDRRVRPAVLGAARGRRAARRSRARRRASSSARSCRTSRSPRRDRCCSSRLRGPFASLHDSDAVAEGMLWAAPGLFCFAINKVLFGVVNGLRRMRAFAVYTSLRYVLIARRPRRSRARRSLDADQLPVIWTFAEGALLLVLLGELVATVPLARCAGWRRVDRARTSTTACAASPRRSRTRSTRKLDVWMLGAAAVATAHVGIYSLAAALNEGAMQLSVVVQNNLNPMIARALARGRGTTRSRRSCAARGAGSCRRSPARASLGALALPVRHSVADRRSGVRGRRGAVRDHDGAASRSRRRTCRSPSSC